MVLEIRLVLQLIKEIQEVLGMDADNVQGCIRMLRRLGLSATIAQEWIVDPKPTLALLEAHLRDIQETIPGWRTKICELIEMI
jgi:hypothetical protein